MAPAANPSQEREGAPGRGASGLTADESVIVSRMRRAIRGRLLVLTGAGVSAESGISTFRGKGGAWGKDDPAMMATPEGFAADPQGVWRWYGERRANVLAARPNPAHDAIARLVSASKEALLVTQNVDDLHERAGTPPKRLVHVHGRIFSTLCARCGLDEEDTRTTAPPPCPSCGARRRPGVVWFGEMLHARDVGLVDEFLSEGPCDLVIVVGTTAMFGYIVSWAAAGARSDGFLLEVNPEPSGLSRFASARLVGPAGLLLPPLVNAALSGFPA